MTTVFKPCGSGIKNETAVAECEGPGIDLDRPLPAPTSESVDLSVRSGRDSMAPDRTMEAPTSDSVAPSVTSERDSTAIDLSNQLLKLEQPTTPHSWISRLDSKMLKRQKARALLRIFVTSLEVQIITTLVVLVDGCVIVWHWLLAENDEMGDDTLTDFDIFEFIVLGIILADFLGRLVGFGVDAYCRNLWNVFDGTMVLLAVVATTMIVLTTEQASEGSGAWRRVVWIARLFRLVTQGQKISNAMRHKVSRNKQRYVDLGGNFDLDLTYITPTVVAMSLPTGSCIMSLYRNPLKDVVRFFQTKHPNSFRIYNACPELPYSEAGFVKAGGSVVHFQIQDHTPPTMNQFVEFLNDVYEFRQVLESAVIAVHCKGGKGRTGSLICAWLMFFMRLSPRGALSHFAHQRTDELADRKKLCGVETPSQVRYIYQLHNYLESLGCRETHSPLPPLGNPTRIMIKALHFEDGLIARPAKMGQLKVLVQCGGVNISGLVEETDYFEADRKKLCGVETPSQVRYVHQLHDYFESKGCLDDGSPPPPLSTPTQMMLNALHFEDGLIAHPAKMGRLKVLIQCGGANVSDLVEETDYFEADVTSIPLSGAVVSSDVRVSVFSEKRLKTSSALDAITASANAYDARGIVLFFLFHTDFMHLTPTRCFGDDSLAIEPGKFHVSVENLDKATKNIKKGTHEAGSSAVLHYE
eukprot:CAMPEP_0172784942 /NCGR_PEP_ID=MMETSP1074-20121228/205192_1 /TAXON_ID=2916 /ORGANISM="Ceratium fusus, Strain PA161109" /LENGTH=695 /DNA_ID=CAMNT_0013621947 /DNA_START=21 /DNA_END=2105 /DNA_ORIENTATION=-